MENIIDTGLPAQHVQGLIMEDKLTYFEEIVNF